MRNLHILGLMLAMVLLSGCAMLPRLDAVPAGQQSLAIIPGLDTVRYRVGADDDLLVQEAYVLIKHQKAYRKSIGETGPLSAVHFLAISGGGDNGAFGAGLLNGWSKAGTRPTFTLVTGVSTGALIAPFAFLGEKYDKNLTDFYTNSKPTDILIPRSILAVITSDSMADNSPLWRKLEKEITQEFLDEIAVEYKKGRLLLVSTTNLDIRQGVIWNLTKIAASQDPRALKLFRSIMIASAAIPGGFPPVMFDVEVNGKKYQEMHVDGGTVSQVFVYPPGLNVKKISAEKNYQRERNLYIIRNSRLDTEWANTERSLMSIAGRAITSLIHTQGMGDLYQIYLTTQRDGLSYNLAFIPPTFNHEHREEFDTKYMRALYKLAYEQAAKGYVWQTAPPGYINPDAK